ncbi:MAG: hypothetical protein ACO1N3_04590 [Gammaproteobacteria bacterium]
MFNLSDIYTDFQLAIASLKKTPKINTISDVHKGPINQKIYSWMALNELIQYLKQQKPDPFDDEADRLELFSIRFVVDRNMRVWFSREGTCSSGVPAHSDMVGDEQVYAAGNLVFSKDYTTIVEITNKSGHYEPQFGTLVFFLSILFALEENPNFPVRIAEEIKLVKYKKQTDFNPVPVSELSVLKADLYHLIPADFKVITTGEYPFIKLRRCDGVQVIEPNQFEVSAEDANENDTSSTGSMHSMDSVDSLDLGSRNKNIKRKEDASALLNRGLFCDTPKKIKREGAPVSTPPSASTTSLLSDFIGGVLTPIKNSQREPDTQSSTVRNGFS